MSFEVHTFRERYRAAISPGYNPWLHAGFVALFGLGVAAALLATAQDIGPWEWLALPLTLLFLNWGEHRIHQGLGHHKRRLGAMFYKRHTGDHHSFFEERHMPFEQARDWRVILFPAWLVLVQSAGAVVLWAVIRPFNPELAAVVGAGWVLGYLLYEVLHACEHLPDSNPVARLPWVRHMRHLHALHHRRDLMQERNMNIVFPLTDWLYGTLHWEPMPTAGLVRQQHVVDLSGTPEAVLDYARDASHWPEWHPSSKAIYGVSGPLPAGATFEEDIESAGRLGHIAWRVTDYQPGRLWSAEAEDAQGRFWLRVTYLCAPLAGGTRFERRMEYRVNGRLLRLLDALFLSRRTEHESRQSLVELKRAWEARAGA